MSLGICVAIAAKEPETYEIGKSVIHDLRSHLAALSSRCSQLDADRDRLDWLETSGVDLIAPMCVPEFRNPTPWTVVVPNDDPEIAPLNFDAKTAREAIDAARLSGTSET